MDVELKLELLEGENAYCTELYYELDKHDEMLKELGGIFQKKRIMEINSSSYLCC